jgi:Ca2+-binding EF-hand superfamily protein/Ran GTPase-activating protein (RanGAP) involved in mRNA processing and transport
MVVPQGEEPTLGSTCTNSLLPSLKEWGSDMVLMLQGIVQDDTNMQKWKLLSEKGVQSFEDDAQVTASEITEDVLRVATRDGEGGQVIITDWGGDEASTEEEEAAGEGVAELLSERSSEVDDGEQEGTVNDGKPQQIKEYVEVETHPTEVLPPHVFTSFDPQETDESSSDRSGLPLDCPPPSAVRSPKYIMLSAGGEDEKLHYYSGAAGRERFFLALRAMHSRPAEADQMRECMEKDGPEGDESGADAAHRVYLDSLAEVSRSLAPPRPTMLHQKHLTILDLTQFGIGDTYGLALASTLAWMTHIKDMRLSDNRLTDNSIPQIIRALSELPDVTALDLSRNKLDGLSSAAVKELLGAENCGIRVFKLSGADVDDDECSELLQVAASNPSLTDLDLSQNLIGLKEPHKVGDPEYETGVDAIAKFLESAKLLRILNLSRNYIGVQGEKESSSAVKLARSICKNTSLVTLNLAYNSMKNLPAQELGNSLNFNETLEELDLSNNNLTPGACSVIASSFAHNPSLTLLNLDGNAPGVIGSRDLLQALRNLKSDRRKLFVSMMNCNSEVTDDSLFDVLNPHSKTYTLHVSRPYDRMMATELKRIATCQDGVRLVKVVVDGEVLKNDVKTMDGWEEDTGRLERRDAKVDASIERNERLGTIIDDIFAASLSEAEVTQWHVLDIFDAMSLRPSDVSVLQIHAVMRDQFLELSSKKDWNPQKILLGVFKAVFYIVDNDQSNALSASEIRNCVEMLGMDEKDWTDEAIQTLIQKYDTDGNGELESEEFISYMMSIFAAAPPKVKGEYYDKIMNKRWEIPSEGVLALTIEVEKSTASIDEVAPDSGVDGLLELIRNASTDIEREKLFHLSTSNTDTYFTRHQAQRLIDMCKSTMSILTLVDRCVRVTASPDDAVAVVEHNLDAEQKVILRLRMGQAWQPIMGLPGGTYVLEFGNHEHNYVGKLMSGIAVSEREESRTAKNNTSQLGDWLNFRNISEQVRQEDPENGAHIVKNKSWEKKSLDPRWLSRLPSKDASRIHLQFDYVSTTRPRADVQIMSDKRFENLLSCLGIDGDKSVLNATPLQDYVDRNLNPEVVQSRYFAMRRSTYREVQRSRAQEEGEGSEGYNWEFPVLFDPEKNTSPQTPSPKKAPATPKKSQEEIAAVGCIRKSVHQPISVQDLGVTSSMMMYRTFLIKLYEVQAHACRLSFSVHQILILWEKFRVPHVNDRNGRTVLQQVDPGGSSILCDLHKDVQLVRMELLLSLFSRIVDIENFTNILDKYEFVFCRSCLFFHPVFVKFDPLFRARVCCFHFDRVSSEDEYEMYHRLGWLNILSTTKPDRWYRIELSVWEQREAIKIFIALAEEEGGKNWLFQRYRRAINQDWVAGWDLPVGWTVETPRNKSGCWDFGFCEFLYATPEAPVERARFEYRKRTLTGRTRNLVSIQRKASDGTFLAI